MAAPWIESVPRLPVSNPIEDQHWKLAEIAVAWLMAMLIGSHFILTHQFAAAFVPALALYAVWWPVVRDQPAARRTLLLGAAALANGLILLVMNTTRPVWTAVSWTTSLELIGVLACAGTMVWVMRTIGVGPAGVAFALGVLLNANPDSAFGSRDPLRFVYATPLILLVLFLAVWLGRRQVEWLALAATVGFYAFLGGRSDVALALMALVVFTFWLIRGAPQTRLPMWFTLTSLVAFALTVYYLGQALLLEGLLGQAAQQRTEYQIQTSGELILGGRPEIAATTGLIRDQIWGYGVGVQPIMRDLQVARDAMWQIGYDPMNGYVERYMFGSNFRLHSMFGDMWAAFGILGAVLVAYLAWQAIRVLQNGSRPGLGDAPTLLLAMQLCWNALFAPWAASIDIVILLLALAWTRARAEPRSRSGSS